MSNSMRGALVAFTPSFIGLMPNVIVFQFNPETITHTWTAAQAADSTDKDAKPNPLAVKGVPGESFAFTLAMDSNDSIADGSSNPIAAGLAKLSGVYTRLAALEMLQYPTGSSGGGLIGGVSASISSSGLGLSTASSASQTVPQSQVPTVLFIWGPQRIVPVRVTALTITERIYDSMLNPSHAEAQITLRVLTPDEIVSVDGPMQQLANIAYVYTQGLRQVQAAANLGDAAAQIIGMLPTPF
ncbi:MAG TPA: hypothetical protein VMB34_19455 [Acetobacteraceae bacterium]|nr:hypothetical protein [Acetobacteraceae bacterium]